MDFDEEYDVIVIGGEPEGVAAAAYLQHVTGKEHSLLKAGKN